jgi:hypothetical protein
MSLNNRGISRYDLDDDTPEAAHVSVLAHPGNDPDEIRVR